MTREEAIAYGNDYYIDLISACCEVDKKHKEFVKMSLEALEQAPIAQERYEDLCEYFGKLKDILENRDDFKAWLDRVKWHIRKAEELYEKYEQEPKYCDRNICVSNEYNGIGCDECEVTKSQKPKIGHWITKDGKEYGYDIGGVKTWYIQIICSECGFIKTAIEGHTGQYNYCPNCGAKMFEPQERSNVE